MPAAILNGFEAANGAVRELGLGAGTTLAVVPTTHRFVNTGLTPYVLTASHPECGEVSTGEEVAVDGEGSLALRSDCTDWTITAVAECMR